MQAPTEVIFLYQKDNTFRLIPTDGRPHDPIRAKDLTLYGDAVGTWDGDTLVIDIVGFSDESWLAWPGYFHSNNMRIVERLRRDGNTLTWQVTVYDDDVLAQPWEMTPDELDASYAAAKESEAAADVQALGEEGAREWNRLQRIANRNGSLPNANGV